MSGSKESSGTEESKKCHNIILMFKKWLYKNICISVCLSDPSVWSLCADTFLFEKNVTSLVLARTKLSKKATEEDTQVLLLCPFKIKLLFLLAVLILLVVLYAPPLHRYIL